MTHADFLESLFSRLAKWSVDSKSRDPAGADPIGSKPAVVALLERQPLFVLGAWDEIVAAIGDLRTDLVGDLADGLLMPFGSIAVAFEGKRGWVLEWVRRLEGEHYVHTSFHETQETAWFRNAIEFEFRGKQAGQFWVELEPESVNRFASVDARADEAVSQDMGRIIEDALLRVALISHPENYVVKRTPFLTAREARRVDRGEPLPIRKRPFYLVMDHKGLIGLRQESKSLALRLPLLHARRGHWMRLAERCRAARATGKDRVWRRETYVGDREFKDYGCKYNIYMSAAEAAQNVNDGTNLSDHV